MYFGWLVKIVKETKTHLPHRLTVNDLLCLRISMQNLKADWNKGSDFGVEEIRGSSSSTCWLTLPSSSISLSICFSFQVYSYPSASPCPPGFAFPFTACLSPPLTRPVPSPTLYAPPISPSYLCLFLLLLLLSSSSSSSPPLSFTKQEVLSLKGTWVTECSTAKVPRTPDLKNLSNVTSRLSFSPLVPGITQQLQ